ncbi:MAG: quinone-dependent dihydroorotate dehydrogenase [Sandaracinaceae bacterium]|nr:quinone-dependent dihydroorotate dehydrogenase [Sandaracinaceae bacterium]
MLYRTLFRPLLFAMPPEGIHEVTIRSLEFISNHPRWMHALAKLVDCPNYPVRAMGLEFPTPIGLAAGFDKNGVAIPAWFAMGFGFVEVGTITPRAQAGNPKPRLFRLPKDKALLNRMGFNNDGAPALAQRLARLGCKNGIVGVNIGKQRETPIQEAAEDYATCASILAPFADYLVINVSSPNTPGLRSLQSLHHLESITDAVRDAITRSGTRHLPLLIKISPDLLDHEIKAIAGFIQSKKLAGVVATNTTTSRAHLRTPHQTLTEMGEGGISGAPLRKRSLEILELLRQTLDASFVVISVGGISTLEDLRLRFSLGATLVQIYTAFVYEGPLLPRRLLSEFIALQSKQRLGLHHVPIPGL